MRVNPHLCPECGEPADRIIEQVIAVAGIDVQEDGTWEYDGKGPDIERNPQKPKFVGESRVGLQCSNRHEWPADLLNEDDEPDEPDDEPTLADKREAFAEMCAEIVAEKQNAAAASAVVPAGDEGRDDQVLIALTLLVTNPVIRAYLEKHDPQLHRQARNAMYEATGLKPINEGGAS
jgi:hypothetical protein